MRRSRPYRLRRYVCLISGTQVECVRTKWTYTHERRQLMVEDFKAGPCGEHGSGWTYQFNAFTGRSECAPPNAVPKYNSLQDEWKLVGRDWVLEYDRERSVWEFRPPR